MSLMAKASWETHFYSEKVMEDLESLPADIQVDFIDLLDQVEIYGPALQTLPRLSGNWAGNWRTSEQPEGSRLWGNDGQKISSVKLNIGARVQILERMVWVCNRTQPPPYQQPDSWYFITEAGLGLLIGITTTERGTSLYGDCRFYRLNNGRVAYFCLIQLCEWLKRVCHQKVFSVTGN